MRVTTKRFENPVYVITHTYVISAISHGRSVLGVYDSQIEAIIDVKNLIEKIEFEMKEEIGYDIIKAVEGEDELTISGGFSEIGFEELHRFKISTFDKNCLYECIGI